MYNYSNYENPEVLAKELVHHFSESMAPIDVVFNSPDEMEPFSLAIDKVEGASNLGGKFLCKKANQGMGSSFRVSEIMQFGESSYPLTITFAKRSQLGAFAYGYVEAFKKKEEDATWKQMVSEGLITREDLEEFKASLADIQNTFPHTRIVDAKSFRECKLADIKAKDSDNPEMAADLVVCRYMRGFDADTLVKAKQILEMQYSGVISEAEADIELDKLEAALYPNMSNDPLEHISDNYATEVYNAEHLAEAGVISQQEAEKRKDAAYDDLVKKSREVSEIRIKENYKKYLKFLVIFAVALFILRILLRALLY